MNQPSYGRQNNANNRYSSVISFLNQTLMITVKQISSFGEIHLADKRNMPLTHGSVPDVLTLYVGQFECFVKERIYPYR